DLQKLTTSPRDDSRIAADHDWHLKASLDHKVNGNSAFYSQSEKATLEEILKPDSLSQVSNPKKSKSVPPRVSAAFPFIRHNSINPTADLPFSSSQSETAEKPSCCDSFLKFA
ncbi:MAG: hypothetical protein WCH39_21540, partial [Schlesneria sp.]